MPTYLVGPTRPYTTIGAALSAIPGDISGTGVHEVVVDSGIYAESPSVVASGSSISDYVFIRCASDSHHMGLIGSGVRITQAFSNTFSFSSGSTSHCRVFGIIFTNNNTLGFNNANACVGYGHYSYFEDCIFIKTGDGYGHGATTGLGNAITPPTTVFYKCLAIMLGTPGQSSRNNGFYGGASGSDSPTTAHNIVCINCGSYGFRKGFWPSQNSVCSATIINCWSYHGGQSGAEDFTGTIDTGLSSNNASRDTTAPGANSLTSQTLAGYGFLNSSSSNFHITSTSVLYNTGLPQSSLFTSDWDLETIDIWCIGPDCFANPSLNSTSSSPWINQNDPHPEVEDAQAPTLSTKASDSAPGRDTSAKLQKDAQAPKLKTAQGESSPNTAKVASPRDGKASQRTIKKGYKDGFLSIMPESNGYAGAVANGTGNKIPILSESLSAKQEFADINAVSFGRQLRKRIDLRDNPGGGFTAPFRTNDCIPILQSHFQKRIGTTPATGTTYYEFAANRDRIVMSGSSFGTGSYNSSGSYSAFTVTGYKQVEGSAYRFTGGLCDALRLKMDANGEALISPSMLFNGVDMIGTNGGYPYGSYSDLEPFAGHQLTATFFGLPVISIEFESNNHIKDFRPVGTSGVKRQFGRYEVNGQAVVDFSKVGLAYFGSMLGASSFAISGTLYNDERNKMVFDMPNCRLKPFELNVNSDVVSVPFSCYESDDGGTAPLTIKLWTRNYSGTSFEPN